MARYALAIGIGEYQTRSFANLSKATNDAEAVARVLEQYGDFQAVERLPKRWNPDKNGFEVARQKLTGAELRQGIKTFLIEQAANSEALIYFTGHGFTVADGFGKPKGYLAASDCLVETESDRIVKQTNGVDFIGFNDLIQESTLSSLVVLLDCCHSGNFLESSMVRQTMTAFSSQRNYYAIAACRSYEEALALKTDEHSIFTGAILKGLARENANKKGEVSGDRLFDYISSAIKATVQQPIHLGWGESVTLVTYQGEDIALEEVTKNRSNPYLGLCSFEREQERYFCGRETAIRLLLDRLSEGRFLAAIGPSGCGKSSLIKAGLLPQLMRDRIDNSSEWGIERFTPGKHPLSTLVEILERKQQQNQPLVLFIDQFEEVFTLCENEAERQSFIELVSNEATDIDKKTRVIVAIRTDFLDRCAAYPEAAKLINRNQPTTYLVTPLSREGIEEAIETPAKLHGATFERGLVSQIADDVDEQPGALPLLQYALKELWRVCIEESRTGELLLTKKGYEQIGGVKGALEKQANIVYKGFVASDQTFVRQLLIELVQLGEGTEVTRRRVRWERLEAIADSINQLRRVVGQLADRRLIVTDEQTVEVAHEALLSEWSLLRNWIEEDRENIRLRRRLEAYCREWQETFKKSDDALLTGARLAAIAEWKDKTQPKLLAEEEEFLKQSLERRDREIQEKIEAVKREEKQRTKFAIAVGVLLTFTLGLGIVAQQLAVDRKQREAIAAGALISKSQQLFEANKQLEALIASVEALKKLRQIGREDPTELIKLQSVIYSVRERNRLEAHQGGVNGVSFSPDGQIIASVGVDKNLIIWDVKGKILLPPLKGHTDEIWSIRFSRDNKIIASASKDRTVRIWNRQGKFVRSLIGHKQTVYDISFSPDNKTIASSSRDGTIKLWNRTNGKLLRVLRDKDSINKQEYLVFGVDFNPFDGSILASTGYEDGYVNIWYLNKKSNDTPKRIGQHKRVVTSVRFSPDGSILASSSYDGTIKLWRAIDGKQVGNINTNKPLIFYSDFSEDGKLIASANQDGIVRIWSVDEALKQWDKNKKSLEKPVEILLGHSQAVGRLAWSYKKLQILASASDDGTVKLWRIDKIDSKINKKLKIDDLLVYSCNLLDSYLKTSLILELESRDICDNFNQQKRSIKQ